MIGEGDIDAIAEPARHAMQRACNMPPQTTDLFERRKDGVRVRQNGPIGLHEERAVALRELRMRPAVSVAEQALEWRDPEVAEAIDARHERHESTTHAAAIVEQQDGS